jgi:hypothetical protein
MTAINRKIITSNPCWLPEFKSRYGLFKKAKKNHSVLRKPNWDKSWPKIDWFGKRKQGHRVPRKASMSLVVNKKNWCPKVIAHKKVIG